MSKTRVLLAANVWTDLSGYLSTVGQSFVIRYSGTATDPGQPIEVGLKATAPSAAYKTIPAKGSAQIISGAGTLKPWARIVAGGYIEIDETGPDIVLVEASAAAS